MGVIGKGVNVFFAFNQTIFFTKLFLDLRVQPFVWRWGGGAAPSLTPMHRSEAHASAPNNHHHLDLYTNYIQHIFERVCPTANPLQLPRSTPPFRQRILTNLPLRHPTPTPGIHNIYLEAAIHNTVNVLSGGFGEALSGGFVLAWRFVNIYSAWI